MSSTGLHPVMAEVMVRHDCDACAPGALPRGRQAQAPYRSLGDAMAYEAGWLSYSPDAPAPAVRTPFADGWWDAFAASERDAECALGLDCIDEERDDDR